MLQGGHEGQEKGGRELGTPSRGKGRRATREALDGVKIQNKLVGWRREYDKKMGISTNEVSHNARFPGKVKICVSGRRLGVSQGDK